MSHVASGYRVMVQTQNTPIREFYKTTLLQEVQGGIEMPEPHDLQCWGRLATARHTWLFFSFCSKTFCSTFLSFFVRGFLSFFDGGGALAFFFFFPGNTSALLASTPFNTSLSEKTACLTMVQEVLEGPRCLLTTISG